MTIFAKICTDFMTQQSSPTEQPISGYYEHQPGIGGLVSKISWYARQKMFKSLMKTVCPTPDTRVLDVGVTCNQRQESNFFEKLYPYPQKI
jgi:hypothetical protein